jgi:hypothetical protein
LDKNNQKEGVTMDITTLFCEIDDFCKIYFMNNKFLKITNKEDEKITRNRSNRMSASEIMTIVILFQDSGYRNFKTFYKTYISQQLNTMFPYLLSYNRFVQIMPKVAIPLSCFLKHKMDTVTGISYIDATKLEVCNKKRISRNKVFDNVAKIGKTSMGWFFGLKLHLIVNHLGGLLAVKVTPGNTNDIKPVEAMVDFSSLFGKLFGDKGYISKNLVSNLQSKGVQLFTPLKSNMHNKLLKLNDKILLRKRAIIETINDQLKNIYQIDHTRHRSVFNFIVNLLSGLIAYCFRENKPSITNFEDDIRENGYLLMS